MPRKKKIMIVLPALLAAYLLLAACWAWTVFDDALAGLGPQTQVRLSPRQADILLRVEDPTFFDHGGVSLAAGQGLATISSALARDVYLGGADLHGAAGLLQRFYRAVFACCRKVDLGRDVMAVVLDARLSKERQLALYAGLVYMGRHDGRQVRGLAQAAQVLLGRPLAAIGDDEFIGLAAMIKAPNRFHPVRDPAAYAERLARVRALVAGTCRPGGWFDTTLESCAGKPPAASPLPTHS